MPASGVEVFVWYQDTRSLDPQALQAAENVLCREERERRDRFRFPEDRRDFVMAHGLLRHSLSQRFPNWRPEQWRFEKNSSGKPYLSGEAGGISALEFNLSHTRGFVACVVSSGRVGIDVERLRDGVDYEGIAWSNYAEQEIKATKALSASDRPARILELWTLKEAFLKGIGTGLATPLDSFWFELGQPGALCFHAPADVASNAWKFATFAPQPEVRVAIAVESTELPRLLLQGDDVAELQRMALLGE
jgi:4'-phosphopantetheinyl transferase